MINTIVFNGGLGNQMFQYAFYLQLRNKHPFNLFVFDLELSHGCHNGYELDRIFRIDSSKKAKNFRRIKKHFPKWLENPYVVKQGVSLEYVPEVLKERSFFIIYEGFWQSEKYFRNVSAAVRKAFQFDETMLNGQTRYLSEVMASENCVSVHVHRGDYVEQKEVFGLCSEEYYHQAIDHIKGKEEQPKFVFFSDDIGWVKDRFDEKDAVFVDWNHGKESWQDMYLMTRCQHNIIANSSFSWWGAWLNPNKDKLVIAPKRWFEFTPNYDVLPEEWLTI